VYLLRTFPEVTFDNDCYLTLKFEIGESVVCNVHVLLMKRVRVDVGGGEC
jgi:hypothetical protein